MQTTMRTEKLNKIVEGLCKVSEKHYINPFDQLKWPETVDRNNWFYLQANCGNSLLTVEICTIRKDKK